MTDVWRAMNSLLVLRNQVNVLAPFRSRASDGLVGDEDHQGTNSDHNPHFVAGVGAFIVTALDLTHDPANGFDSYWFAEILRRNRDKRIKYVISNHRIMSSYATSSRPAWVWGPYSGSDPHTNHVHISVLNAVISDMSTPWNLEGYTVMNWTDKVPAGSTDNDNRTYGQCLTDTENLRNWEVGAEDSATGPGAPPVDSREWLLHARIRMLEENMSLALDKLNKIISKLDEDGSSGTGSFTLSGTISGSVSGSGTVA